MTKQAILERIEEIIRNKECVDITMECNEKITCRDIYCRLENILTDIPNTKYYGEGTGIIQEDKTIISFVISPLFNNGAMIHLSEIV
jgi:hypothetical protein